MIYEAFLSLAITLFTLLAFARYDSAATLLAALLPSYLLRVAVFGVPSTFLELATWAALFAGLSHASVRQQWRARWNALPRIFKLSVGLFIASALYAAWVNLPADTVARALAIRHSLGVFKGWIITPLIWGWVVSSSRFRSSAMPLLLSGTAVSIVGLFQVFYLPRIQSIYDVPNSLALFIVPLIILALWSPGVFSKLSGIIMFVALLGTRSVGGMLALFTTFLAGRWLYNTPHPTPLLSKERAPAVFLVFAAFLIIIFLSPRLSYFFANPLPTSLQVRLQLWQASVQLITEHPAFGIGLGRFEPSYQHVVHGWFAEQRPGTLPEFVFRDPHNWILSFWLNTGLVGLISFVILNGATLWYGRTRPAYILALVSLLIFGLVDTVYWKNDLAALYWLLLFMGNYLPKLGGTKAGGGAA